MTHRFRLEHIFNDDPDHDAMARLIFDFLLAAERDGTLDVFLGSEDSQSPPERGDGEAA